MPVHSKLEIEEASAKRLRITQGSLVYSVGYKHGTPDGVRVLRRHRSGSSKRARSSSFRDSSMRPRLERKRLYRFKLLTPPGVACL